MKIDYGWGILEIILLIIFLFLSSIVISMLVGKIIYGDAHISDLPAETITDPPVITIFISTALNNLISVGYIFLIQRIRKRSFNLAINSPSIKAILLSIIVIPILALTIKGIFSIILMMFGINPELQTIAELILSAKSFYDIIFPLFLGIIVAPITEEIIFRGFIHRGLRRYMGSFLAMILSGIIFGLAHFTDPQAIIPVSFLGIFLAFSFEKTNSIIVPIAGHISNNLISFILLFLFSSYK